MLRFVFSKDFFLLLGWIFSRFFFSFFHISHKLGTHHVSDETQRDEKHLCTHIWKHCPKQHRGGGDKKKAFVFPCEKWAAAQCDLKPAQHQFNKSGSRQKWQNRHYWSLFEMCAVCSGLVLIIICGHVSILTQKSAQTWTQMLLFKKGHLKGSFQREKKCNIPCGGSSAST